MVRGWPALVLCLAALAGGCATSGARPGALTSSAGPAAAWYDGQSGERLAPPEVAARLEGAKVILVGERHADPASMSAHVAVLTLLSGRSVEVAVEWLPRSARLAVRGWLQSDEPVESLAEAVGWEQVWGHPLAAYRPVLEAVRRLRFSLTPVNAEPGLARLVARHGADGVPEERRAELPPLTSGNAAHRAWFEGVMRHLSAHGHGHGHGQGDLLARLYLAQLVWDETMAAQVTALADAGAPVVVFAGTGHVGFGFGIPERIPARLSRMVVLPAETAEEARARAVHAPLSDGRAEAGARLREADIFVVTEPSASAGR